MSMLNAEMDSSVLCFLHSEKIETVYQSLELVDSYCSSKIKKFKTYSLKQNFATSTNLACRSLNIPEIQYLATKKL